MKHIFTNVFNDTWNMKINSYYYTTQGKLFSKKKLTLISLEICNNFYRKYNSNLFIQHIICSLVITHLEGNKRKRQGNKQEIYHWIIYFYLLNLVYTADLIIFT